MRTVALFLVLALLGTLAGCQEIPAGPTGGTEPMMTTAPEETELPDVVVLPPTEPVETQPQQTEQIRVYVPQDPDPLTYPEGELQATLLSFAQTLYVNDNREGSMTERLPEDFAWMGEVSGSDGTAVPAWELEACHIPLGTAVYASVAEPDYLYYQTDGGFRRMIRAGLVKNYWDGTEAPAEASRTYALAYFQSLMNADIQHNPYNLAAFSTFETPAEVDISLLFYNGFREEMGKKLTSPEKSFLLSDGWGENMPVGNAVRLPVYRMQAVLERFFGTGFSYISSVGLDGLDSYWGTTDCYYIWRSDVLASRITVETVAYDVQKDVYTVGYSNDLGPGLMELQKVGQTYRILSNWAASPQMKKDPLSYPKEDIPATLAMFADLLYVNDNWDVTVVEELPEGYAYVGSALEGCQDTQVPGGAFQVCHIPGGTDIYASPEEPDYIYYKVEGGYRRMIRAGLVENYWDGTKLDWKLPEDYLVAFFRDLMTGNATYSPYYTAAFQEFRSVEYVDLYELLYNGFPDLDQRYIPLTDAEKAFLSANGWGENKPMGNATRFPLERIAQTLRNFFGTRMDEISGRGMDRWELYNEETQTYYHWRSDTYGGSLDVTDVYFNPGSGTVRITYGCEFYETDERVMTLRRVGEMFVILSNLSSELYDK